MANKPPLEYLAAQIQQAVESYDEADSTSWVRIQDAMYELRRATEPPHVFVRKQRFHVCQSIIQAIEIFPGY